MNNLAPCVALGAILLTITKTKHVFKHCIKAPKPLRYDEKAGTRPFACSFTIAMGRCAREGPELIYR